MPRTRGIRSFKGEISKIVLSSKNYQKLGENKTKIPASGQTCGQVRKMGLFNPRSREEQAHYDYYKNARFQEILRENKRKSEVRLNLRFWSE